MNYEIWTNMSGLISEPIGIGEMAMMPVPPATSYFNRVIVSNAFIVESVDQPELKALVGGGFPPPDVLNRLAFPTDYTGGSEIDPVIGGGPDSLLKALGQMDIDPDEIKLIVVQHMHWDFEWAVDLFPNAQVIIHKKEVLAAIDPTPNSRFGSPREGTRKVLSRRQPGQLLIIEDDYEPWPGFLILHTPGHTDGHLAVIVQTEKGRACIGSENGWDYASWYPTDARYYPKDIYPAPYSFLYGHFKTPQHICGDPYEHEQSMLKVLRHLPGDNDIHVPMFDVLVPRALPYQWWQHPDPEYAERMKQELPRREPVGGLFPECLEYLPMRKERLERRRATEEQR
jgi:hypothetical protein